jgi:hypothetical protein
MNIKTLLSRDRSMVGLLAILCLIGGHGADVWAGECEDRIATVRRDVDTVDFSPSVSTRTRDSLKAKLDSAVQKLQEGKNADAKLKLQDFKDAVLLMRDAPKKKISREDASLLLDGSPWPRELLYDDGVNGAIGCVCLLP